MGECMSTVLQLPVFIQPIPWWTKSIVAQPLQAHGPSVLLTRKLPGSLCSTGGAMNRAHFSSQISYLDVAPTTAMLFQA